LLFSLMTLDNLEMGDSRSHLTRWAQSVENPFYRNLRRQAKRSCGAGLQKRPAEDELQVEVGCGRG